MKSSRIKVISIGDCETGKSCLIKRYCEKRFISKYLPTIGVDFGVTNVVIGDRTLKVNLFDLSGNSLFKEVRNEFYRDTQAVLIVFDITSRSTFESLGSWLNELKSYIPNPKDYDKIIFTLCGNKADKSSRNVQFEKAQAWAREQGFHYFETSAQSGDGVNEAFETMFESLVKVIETGRKPEILGTGLGYTKEQVDVILKLKECRDNYSRLGVTRNASHDDINKAYRKLAKLLHPDKCKAPGSAEAFKILSAAKDALIENKLL